MANLTEAEPVIVSSESRASDSPPIAHADSPSLSADTGNPWNVYTIAALLALLVLWAVKLYTTWGAWGNLSIDSGHEMYIPALLVEGKQLYRDVWYMYGPAAPYITSSLYRLFGVNLNVLYWAGSLSALGSAVFLYLTGMRLSSWVIGWTAGAVVLLEAFQFSLFCFPLPYASAAVYGCLTGCFFLWLAVSACYSRNWLWMFAGGSAAALALLLKPEFGIACYGTLAILIAARWFLWRSWRLCAGDVASSLPGMVVCGLVIRWMVSIAGAEFITQENIVSWPTSYYMKTFGKRWLERNGFALTGSAFWLAFQRSFTVAAVLFVLYALLKWRRYDKRSLLWKALMASAVILYLDKNNFFILSAKQSAKELFSAVFFPQDMVLYVIVAAVAAWCAFWWRPAAARNLAVPLLLTFSGLLSFRILMKMRPSDYAIYCNGPVVLSFLLLLFLIVPRSNQSRRFVLLAEAAVCLACLTPVVLNTWTSEAAYKTFVPLVTARGTVRVTKTMAANYTAAIQFMKEKASLGQSVLSVPEDTSLYFLSSTYSPTRVFSFTPGVLAPGRMTEKTIQEIEEKQVRYLLWSNRRFSEYGVPVFGRDFDREVGDYLKAHYRPVGPLIPKLGDEREWDAVVWERNP